MHPPTEPAEQAELPAPEPVSKPEQVSVTQGAIQNKPATSRNCLYIQQPGIHQLRLVSSRRSVWSLVSTLQGMGMKQVRCPRNRTGRQHEESAVESRTEESSVESKDLLHVVHVE